MLEDSQSNLLRFPRVSSRKAIAHGKELIRRKWLHILFLRVQCEQLIIQGSNPAKDAPPTPPAA